MPFFLKLIRWNRRPPQKATLGRRRNLTERERGLYRAEVIPVTPFPNRQPKLEEAVEDVRSSYPSISPPAGCSQLSSVGCCFWGEVGGVNP